MIFTWFVDVYSVKAKYSHCLSLTLILLNTDLSFFENTVDPDQLAFDEYILSGSTLFSIMPVFFCPEDVIFFFTSAYIEAALS